MQAGISTNCNCIYSYNFYCTEFSIIYIRMNSLNQYSSLDDNLANITEDSPLCKITFKEKQFLFVGGLGPLCNTAYIDYFTSKYDLDQLLCVGKFLVLLRQFIFVYSVQVRLQALTYLIFSFVDVGEIFGSYPDTLGSNRAIWGHTH